MMIAPQVEGAQAEEMTEGSPAEATAVACSDFARAVGPRDYHQAWAVAVSFLYALAAHPRPPHAVSFLYARAAPETTRLSLVLRLPPKQLMILIKSPIG